MTTPIATSTPPDFSIHKGVYVFWAGWCLLGAFGLGYVLTGFAGIKGPILPFAALLAGSPLLLGVLGILFTSYRDGARQAMLKEQYQAAPMQPLQQRLIQAIDASPQQGMDDIREAILAGADPYGRDAEGLPLLVRAVRTHLQAVQGLLFQPVDGAKIGLPQALLEAVGRNDEEMVRCLLRAGAMPNEATPEGVSPSERLMQAGHQASPGVWAACWPHLRARQRRHAEHQWREWPKAERQAVYQAIGPWTD